MAIKPRRGACPGDAAKFGRVIVMLRAGVEDLNGGAPPRPAGPRRRPTKAFPRIRRAAARSQSGTARSLAQGLSGTPLYPAPRPERIRLCRWRPPDRGRFARSMRGSGPCGRRRR
jgi:hypothetical protein